MARKKNPDTIEIKPCLTCGINFSSPKYKNRKFCSKKCSCNNLEVKQKNRDGVKKTLEKNYGGHHMKCSIGKESLKKSLIEKYGVEHYSKHPDYSKKVKDTKKIKYGNENYNNINKYKETCLERYGVYSVSNVEEIKEKRSSTKRKNHWFKLIDHLKTQNINCLSNIEDYKGQNFINKYKFQCTICNNIFLSGIYTTFKYVYCEKCNPGRLNEENEVYDFLRELLPNEIIIRRDRTILKGRELDFYIPSKNIAIEYNGLYWHSEIGGKCNKTYHLNKLKHSIISNITLIHIFSNEWLENKEIVKSILRSKLKLISNRVFARKCTIKEISFIESKNFLISNHMQGSDKSKIRLGLFNENELVSIMTFCKSRYNKKFDWEMSRFCSKINTIVIGSCNKLFKYFIKKYNPKNIITYSDRRYFSGNCYKHLGFNFIDNTSPNYFYLDYQYKIPISRICFQKHKLKNILPIFNDSISEWENMKLNKYDRIWDCGNGKWIWNNK